MTHMPGMEGENFVQDVLKDQCMRVMVKEVFVILRGSASSYSIRKKDGFIQKGGVVPSGGVPFWVCCDVLYLSRKRGCGMGVS